MDKDIKKKMLSAMMAGAIATSSASAMNSDDYKQYMEADFQFQQNYYDYIMNVQNANENDYNSFFVDFYRNGKILINNVLYDVDKLYIYECKNDETTKIMLLFNGDLTTDIITGESHIGYKRVKMTKFINSSCFYEIFMQYQNCINENYLIIEDDSIDTFCEILQNYDGNIHDKTPETFYGKGRY